MFEDGTLFPLEPQKLIMNSIGYQYALQVALQRGAANATKQINDSIDKNFDPGFEAFLNELGSGQKHVPAEYQARSKRESELYEAFYGEQFS